jgi:hypothetical protein
MAFPKDTDPWAFVSGFALFPALMLAGQEDYVVPGEVRYEPSPARACLIPSSLPIAGEVFVSDGSSDVNSHRT